MKMTIKSISLQNFKGCTERKVEFDGNTKVYGANSMGKSTLFCAWMWLMGGVNEQLVSNPNIVPLGATECSSTVEAEILIDDKPCVISKTQKYKEKYDDTSGKTVSSTTNSYSINGVEKSAAMFVSEMKERGVDMDNFLMLSHVFAFTADTSKKGREGMRKVLFEMVDNISDLDIAKEMSGVADLTIELGRGFKVEEVEQMAKSSLKKLNDTYGKSGELIDARIQGLIEGKADINLTAMAEKEMNIREQIKQTEAEIESLNTNMNDARIAELENRIKEIEFSIKEEYYKKRDEHMTMHNELIDKYRDVETVINTANKVITENENEIGHLKYLLDVARKSYEEIYSSHYDGETICPVCHQELPEPMISEAKTNFEKDKSRKLEDLIASGEKLNINIDEKERLIEDAKATISKVTPSLKMLKEQIDESNKVDMSEPTFNDNPEINALKAEISTLRASTADSSALRLHGLNEFLESLRKELSEVYATYNAAENNKTIDGKISELREQKRNVEIQRSQHEKMIYEVEVFKQYKNTKLSDVINSHFHVAQFRLYKILKNGSIEDDCAVLVDGKEMNTQLNQASQILARLDIIRGLSDFKQTWFPIFLDDFALFTAESEKTITMENQLIKLIAADGYNELTIAKGE